MEKIVKIVKQLVSLHNNNSPFELCKLMGIKIIFIDLPRNTKGLFVKTKKNDKLVLLNNSLDLSEIKFVCAHELAHAVMHSNNNAICIEKDTKTLEKLDKEADYFAELLLKESSKNLNNV